jgi:hypothetical protein
MIRVLLIADNTLLADGIESILVKEMDLDVLRLTHREPGKVDQAIRNQRSIVFIVEDGASNHESITPGVLFCNYGCLLMFTISPEKLYLHFSENCQIPFTGMKQVIDLVRAFSSTKSCRES